MSRTIPIRPETAEARNKKRGKTASINFQLFIIYHLCGHHERRDRDGEDNARKVFAVIHSNSCTCTWHCLNDNINTEEQQLKGKTQNQCQRIVQVERIAYILRYFLEPVLISHYLIISFVMETNTYLYTPVYIYIYITQTEPDWRISHTSTALNLV